MTALHVSTPTPTPPPPSALRTLYAVRDLSASVGLPVISSRECPEAAGVVYVTVREMQPDECQIWIKALYEASMYCNLWFGISTDQMFGAIKELRFQALR